MAIDMNTDWGAEGAQLTGAQVQQFIKKELTDLQQEVETANGQIKTLTNNKDELWNQITQLNKKNSAQAATNNAFQASIDSLEDTDDNLQTEIDNLKDAQENFPARSECLLKEDFKPIVLDLGSNTTDEELTEGIEIPSPIIFSIAYVSPLLANGVQIILKKGTEYIYPIAIQGGMGIYRAAYLWGGGFKGFKIDFTVKNDVQIVKIKMTNSPVLTK